MFSTNIGLTSSRWSCLCISRFIFTWRTIWIAIMRRPFCGPPDLQRTNRVRRTFSCRMDSCVSRFPCPTFKMCQCCWEIQQRFLPRRYWRARNSFVQWLRRIVIMTSKKFVCLEMTLYYYNILIDIWIFMDFLLRTRVALWSELNCLITSRSITRLLTAWAAAERISLLWKPKGLSRWRKL